MSQCELFSLCPEQFDCYTYHDDLCSPTLAPGANAPATEEEKTNQEKEDAVFWRAFEARMMYDKGVFDVEHEQGMFEHNVRAILHKRKAEDRGMNTMFGWCEMSKRRILEDKILAEQKKRLTEKEKRVKADVLADLASKGIVVDSEGGQSFPFDIVFKEEMKKEMKEEVKEEMDEDGFFSSRCEVQAVNI